MRNSHIVKLLKQHVTEKKVLSSLYKLEQITIDLVKLNRQIVALATILMPIGDIMIKSDIQSICKLCFTA